MIRRFLSRLLDVLVALLVMIDVIGCTLWLSPLYLFGLAQRPTGRQLISSYVGYCAISEDIAGKRGWASVAADVIDAIFWWQPNHCRATYQKLELCK